jgi:hypothetical protein
LLVFLLNGITGSQSECEESVQAAAQKLAVNPEDSQQVAFPGMGSMGEDVDGYYRQWLAEFGVSEDLTEI